MNRIIVCSCFIFFIVSEPIFSGLHAYISSVRKNGTVTITFTEKPEKEFYHAKTDPNISFRIVSISPSDSGFNAIAVVQNYSGESVRVGTELDIGDTSRTLLVDQKSAKRPEDSRPLKKTLVSVIDGRDMILIPSSFFYFGSDDGAKDEGPKAPVHLDSYYIDKYEVSNADYLRFVELTHSAYPRSWGGVKPAPAEYDLPVIVSYTEAEVFSIWAGKRIPTEEEWEKSASGSIVFDQLTVPSGYHDILKHTIFSWGEYASDKCNSSDYWEIKKSKNKNASPGLLSIKEPLGISAFGLYNIAGNASEWTSTWYDARPGSKTTNFRYGKQVKVIKGGSWYSKKQSLRIQNREYGGIPNLEKDSIAGFRCVRYPVEADKSD